MYKCIIISYYFIIFATQNRKFYLMYRLIYLLILSLVGLPLWASAKLDPSQADSLAVRAERMYASYRYMDALDLYDQALSVAQQTHNDPIQLRSLLYIGNIHNAFGNNEMALHYYSQCRELARQRGNEQLSSSANYNMLMCHSLLGHPDEAQQCYDLLAEMPLPHPQLHRFYSLTGQALLAQARGDVHAALYFNREALTFAEHHDMSSHILSAQMGRIGTQEEQLGHYDEALQWYQRSAEMAEESHSMAALCSCYDHLSRLYRELNNDSASMYYQRLFVQLDDSLFSERDYNNSSGRQSRREQSYNHQVISSLSEQVSFQTYVIVVFVVMLISLVVLLVVIRRQNQRLVETQRLIIAKHQEMDRQLQQQASLGAEYLKVVGGVEPLLPTEAAQPAQSDEEETTAEEEEMVTSNVPLLNQQQTEVLLAAVNQVLENSEIICDPEFSLKALADRVGSNTRYVSWAVNASYGKSFKTLLNEYRIREAARRLSDREVFGHLTIAAISEQIGYKSPTSFNTAFKRVFGMTPAAYQKLTQRE